MKHYPHLLARLFNVPLLIDPAKASVIYQGIAARLSLPATGELIEGPAAQHRARREMSLPAGTKWSNGGFLMTPDGIAIVTIDGSLVHSAAGSYAPSGMTAYGEIRDQIEAAAADPRARAILLDVDSPGGEASDSAFALSARIRGLRAEKPIWAICDEMACSAGYLLASAAEKIFAPALGYVGSIGVYMALLDTTKADQMEGLSWTFIKAGAHKLDGNPHVKVSQDFIARMQADVDATYERFIAEVGASRPMLGLKGARATEARFYRGTEAMDIKLIDGIADFDATLAALKAKVTSPGMPPVIMEIDQTVRQEASAEAAGGDTSQRNAAAAADQTEETQMDSKPQNTEQPQPSAAQQAGNVVDLNAARKEGSDAARADILEIGQLCNLAGRPELALGFIEAGKSVADVRKELLDARAKQSAEIASHHAAGGGRAETGGAALLGACKQLADRTAPRKSA